MVLKSAILTWLIAQPVSKLDRHIESTEERMVRLDAVAQAVANVADRASCTDQPQPCRRILDRYAAAGVVLAQARRESSFRRDVQMGECRPAECDRGRAKGLWQIHQAPIESSEQWLSYASLDADDLEGAAWRTLTLWAGGAYSNGVLTPKCGFSRLAGLAVCGDYGEQRAKEAAAVAAWLRNWKGDE